MACPFDLLKTDYIEVMQIHNLVDWQTRLQVLEEMKGEGREATGGPTKAMARGRPEGEAEDTTVYAGTLR